MQRNPWSPAQARLVMASNVGAATLLAISASTVGGRPFDDQIAWVNVAVLSVLTAAVANGCLLLVARRSIGRRRLTLLPDVGSYREDRPARPGSLDGWWWVPGTARAHRSGCPMTAGRAAVQAESDLIRTEGLQRCEVCG